MFRALTITQRMNSKPPGHTHPDNGLRLEACCAEHSGLVVHDLDASVTFFTDAFGYAVDEVLKGLSDEIADMVGVPDAKCDLVLLRPPTGRHRIELIQYTAGPNAASTSLSPTALGSGHVAFIVGSVREALERLELLGARPLGSVVDYPDGPAVYCRAPGGCIIELMEVGGGRSREHR
ncbi:MAG: hypothetical protein QOJ13_1895 [Gaiellales bacterium]|nr:hypothetical protein [Gaiellales bacterium]